jgi:hypothetical protein
VLLGEVRGAVLPLLLLFCCCCDGINCKRGRDALVVSLVGGCGDDNVDVLSFLFLELSDLGGEGVLQMTNRAGASQPVQVRRAPHARSDWAGQMG